MNTEEDSYKPSKSLIAGIVLSVIALIGVYAGMFISAYLGSAPDSRSGYASIFWHALFFAMLLKALNKKKYIGVIIGVIIGILAFFGSAYLAGYQSASNKNSQVSLTSEWSQSQLTETYMRSISKDICMLKTIESLKKCDSDKCIKTLAAVTGDCVTFAQGSMNDFCSSYDLNYTTKYCDTGILSEKACRLIQATKTVSCK